MPKMTPCLLTTKDFTILEVMLDRCMGTADPMSRLLSKKLAAATVVFRDDIPEDVATMNSRIRYRLNGGPAETRILAHSELAGLVGMTLPVTNPRGLAMLGLAAGETTTIEPYDGTVERLDVLDVLFQPERARRQGNAKGLPNAVKAGAPMLKVVHSADRRPGNDDYDGPGPSAA